MKDRSAASKLNGFAPVALLLVIVFVVGAVIVGAKVVENPRILGTSNFLAENIGGPGPGPGGGDSQPPQQQSQPQPQEQPPQQNTQNNPQPAGVPQVDNRPLNQQNSNTQQNPHPGIPQGDFRPLNQQNSGSAGSGQGGPQPNNPQEQQRFQQLQQQWQQEASKFGFQIQPGSASTQGPSGGNGSGIVGNTSFPSIQGNFNVGAIGPGGGGQQINLNDGNTKITLGSFRAVRPDGSQFDIDKGAAEKINAAIKLVTGSEVSQNGNTFTVKRGEVSALTDLPLSFNVATKLFTVQTGAGEREIKVLPDEAVAKIEESNSNFTANSDSVKLIELNNEPVFEVPGTSQQKFLGLVSVGIQQTSVVSAKDGNLVATNQSTVSRILDILSF